MKTQAKLGKVQLRMMQILWADGSATARQMTDALSVDEPIARSTVQTLLRKLEAKGAVRHEDNDGIFRFYPVFQEGDVAESAAEDLINRVFAGSISGFVSHLLKREKIDAGELEKLREIVAGVGDGKGDHRGE